MAAGDVVDAILLDTPEDEKPSSRARSRARTSDPREPRDAKTGPPSIDEWTGFFSRVVLRGVTDMYINYAFRGIDEDVLSDRELKRLSLTDDERKLIVVPFAELSNKSKFMRRHGRMIVASGDAVNSIIVMGAWMNRVNRIASKYRPRQPKIVRMPNGNSGPGTQGGSQAPASPNGYHYGADGGTVPQGFPIFPGSG